MDTETPLATDFQTFMSSALISGLALWLLIRKPLGVPPGPRWRTPILGNLREFASHFGLKSSLQGLRCTYGDIYSLFLGRRLVVIVSGRDAINRVLKKDEKILERNDVLGEMASLVGSKSKLNKGNKLFMKSLESVLGNSYILQDRISKSVESLIETMTEKADSVIDPVTLISKSVTNLITSIFWGQSRDREGLMITQFSTLCEELSNLRGQQILMTLVPLLRYLPSEREQCKRLDEIKAKIKVVFDQEVKDSRSVWEWKGDDFLSIYFNKVNQENDKNALKDSELCDMLVLVYMNLARSITSMVYSGVWFLMMYPNIQRQVHSEILETGSDPQSNIEEKQILSVTEAFMFETKRFVKMNSLLDYARQTTDEMRLLGYAIPKDTMVLVDTESLMTDPTVWRDPSEFKLDRFLNETGHIIKNERYLDYLRGDGYKWMDTFTDTTAVLYITALLQKFSVEKPRDVKLERYHRNTRFTARFVPRF